MAVVTINRNGEMMEIRRNCGDVGMDLSLLWNDDQVKTYDGMKHQNALRGELDRT